MTTILEEATYPATQTILASAARTATVTVEFKTPPWAIAVYFVLDVTLDAASASITPNFDAHDRISDKTFTLLDGAAVAAVGTTVYKIGPGLTAAANTVANEYLPEWLSFTMAVADADAITYSLAALWV